MCKEKGIETNVQELQGKGVPIPLTHEVPDPGTYSHKSGEPINLDNMEVVKDLVYPDD